MKTVMMIAAVSLALGGAGGYLVGSSGNNDSTKDQEAATPGGATQRVSRSRSYDRTVSREARLNAVMARPGQTDRLQGMLDLYDRLRPEDFEAEAERLRGLQGAERFIGAFLLYSKWGEVDPLGAMAHIEKLGFIGMMVRPIALQGWAGSDPEGAVKYFEENKSMFAMMSRFGGGNSPAATIAGEWARQNPEAALEWAKTLEGDERMAAGSSVFSNLAMTDPKRAASMAAALEDADERSAAIGEVARNWGMSDYEASKAWVDSLPPDQQAAAEVEVMRGLAQSDPSRAAEEVLKLPQGEQRQEAVGDVAENLAMQDPERAASFLMQNGSEEVQSRKINDVMRSWTATDDPAARAFVEQQPAGEVRDNATAAYVTNSNGDPVERLEMARGIQDENLQRRSTMRTARQWMREDPEAAGQWIETTDTLDDVARERLQRGGGGFFGRGRR